MQIAWLAYLFLIFFTVHPYSQNCDLNKLEKDLITCIKTGAFKEGQIKAEEWPACANSPATAYQGYIYQFQLYRNDRRYRHAFRAMGKADSLFQKINKNEFTYFPDHYLMMAEAAAIRKKFDLAKNYLTTFTEINNNPAKADLAYAAFIKAFIAQEGDQKFDEAQQLYREALNKLLEVPEQHFYHIGQTLRYLGATNRVLGDFEQSLYFYEQELVNYEKNYPADHREIANTHYNIGAVLYELLRYEEALSHFLITHESWSKFRKPDDRFMRYLNEAIGDMYWELGNREKTLEYYDLSIAGEKPINNDQAYAMLEQGDALLVSGNEKSAMQYFQQALDWRMSMYGEQHAMTGACQNFIGKKLFEAGHFDEAILAYQRTIHMLVPDMNDTSFLANPDPSLHPISDHDLLEALSSKGIALAERQKISNSAEDAFLAYETLELAIHWMEQIRMRPISDGTKAFWSGKHQRVFEELILMANFLFIKNNDPQYLEKAFAASEKSKAFLLLSALQSQQANAFMGVPDSVVKKEQALQKSILAYEGKINLETQRCGDARDRHLELWQQKLLAQKTEYDALLQHVEKTYPAYHTLKYNVEPTSIQKVQQQLLNNNQNAMLEFFDGREKLFLFLISKEDVRLFIVEKDAEYVNRLNDFIKNINAPDHFLKQPAAAYANFKTNAFYIFKKLLQEPLKNLSSSIEHLYIIPDGQLYFLPFTCLLTDNPEIKNRNYQQLPYLIFNYSTSYSQSATLLCQEIKNEKPKEQYLSFAPDYELAIYENQPMTIHPLFSNQQEAGTGESLLQGRSFLGINATENAFKNNAPNAAILHLPLHTLIDPENPMLSRLLFSPDVAEDGVLHSFELYNLRLKAELAILSACNSGTGQVQTGEGMMSLERGFQYAGCTSLLTTLWTVDDAATSSLSISFLENIKNGMQKNSALKQAQLNYLNSADPAMSHPFYWAGFRVVGDINAISLRRSFHRYFLLMLGLLIFAGLFWRVRKKLFN